MGFLELLVVAGVLAVLLLPVHIGVFWFRRRRGSSTRDAFRFALVGVGVVFAFVFGLTGLGKLLDVSDMRAERDCARLGGERIEVAQPDGRIGHICIVR